MLTNCDMCGTEIVDGWCSCGRWEEDTKDHPFRKSLEEFNRLEKFVITGDAPHLGCAMVMFRGDVKDCERVTDFIYEMKGRKFYPDKVFLAP